MIQFLSCQGVAWVRAHRGPVLVSAKVSRYHRPQLRTQAHWLPMPQSLWQQVTVTLLTIGWEFFFFPMNTDEVHNFTVLRKKNLKYFTTSFF